MKTSRKQNARNPAHVKLKKFEFDGKFGGSQRAES